MSPVFPAKICRTALGPAARDSFTTGACQIDCDFDYRFTHFMRNKTSPFHQTDAGTAPASQQRIISGDE
jgi:hypothetical protein